MRKKMTKTLLLAAALLLPGIQADAQGLGGLLNKAKNTVKKAEKVFGSDTSEASKAKDGKQITLDNGISISNPLSSAMEIVPVGLYGTSTSENYGNCYLVIKVKMLLPESKSSFGSVGSERMMAVGPDGKTYQVDAGGSYPFQTPEGIMVNVAMDEKDLKFEGVKKSVTEMQMVKFGAYVDYNTKGYVTLRNVPIFWDETPE